MTAFINEDVETAKSIPVEDDEVDALFNQVYRELMTILISDPTAIAYYLSNAVVETPLLKLAQVASTRYTVEQCIEEAKGETGLDEYEVRHWHSWHRHITLSMMAHAWLASIRYKETEQKGGLSPSWPS